MTTEQWKKRHPRCDFCKNLEVDKRPLDTLGNELYFCKAKNKTVLPDLPRPFCVLFKVREVKE